MPRRSSVPADYGEPIKYDPTFKGPLHHRSCTDVICLLIFVVFLVAWGFISAYAITNGNVNRLLVPTDTQGLKCGMDSSVRDKPYLVFFDVANCLGPTVTINGCPTPQMCVKKCPTEDVLKVTLNKDNFLGLREKLICKERPESLEMFHKFVDDGKCAENVFKSQAILGRCISDLRPIACKSSTAATDVNSGEKCLRNPDKAMDRLKSRTSILDTYVGLIVANWITLFTNEKSKQEVGTMVIEDLVNARWWIVFSLFIIMLVCLIYISLMRWLACPVVWLSLLALLGLLSYSIYLSYTRYAWLRDNHVELKSSNTNIKAAADSVLSLKETWLVILIVACILLVVILLTVIFLRKRIVIAIALIEEGSKAVASVKSTLMFPVFPWVLQVLVVGLAVVVALYLGSLGNETYRVARHPKTTECQQCFIDDVPVKEGDSCTPDDFQKSCPNCPDIVCHYVGVVAPHYVYYLHAVNVVGFFWLEFFIEGLAEMILAATFATWYWTYKKSDVPFFTLTKATARSFRYHLGTVAFGSFIITVCRLIRVMLEYIDHKVKNYDNVITRAILCCCKCCFACLESFLRFINKNAYIMCAVHGKGFFGSAKDAFSLLMRNILRVFVIDKVTDFLFFISKLVIAIGSGAAAYFAFTDPSIYQVVGEQQLHYDLVPAIIIGIAAYLIATVFFGVYSMAVDTLFLCFLEDCERNDGTPEKPYFMSKQLMKILGKKNKRG